MSDFRKLRESMIEPKAINYEIKVDENGYFTDIDPNNEMSLPKITHKKTTFITEYDKTQGGTKNSIPAISKANLPKDIAVGDHAKMPSNVEFKRVINNILNAMKFLNSNEYEENEENFTAVVASRQDSNENWRRYLESPENEKVFSDAFWYCIIKFLKEEWTDEDLKDETEQRGEEGEEKSYRGQSTLKQDASGFHTEGSRYSYNPKTSTGMKESILSRSKDLMKTRESEKKEGVKDSATKGGATANKAAAEKRQLLKSSQFLARDQDVHRLEIDKRRQYLEDLLLSRISKNYVDLFLTVEQEHKPIFFEKTLLSFQRYFDILSQGVFYSYFYAYPKSRPNFNDEVKEKILLKFAKLFTGIDISNPHKYYSLWCLDLGAGNVIKTNLKQPKVDSNDVQNFPLLSVENVKLQKAKRTRVNLQYSEIVSKYLTSQKYQTRGLVKNFWMRFSQVENNQEGIEQKFAVYQEMLKQIEKDKKRIDDENRKANESREAYFLKIKNECYKHQKRLQKRKMEELEKGAHEYANYLVSMLNAATTQNNQAKTHK